MVRGAAKGLAHPFYRLLRPRGLGQDAGTSAHETLVHQMRAPLAGLCTEASTHKPVTIELVRRQLWMLSQGFSMSSGSILVGAGSYAKGNDAG